MLRFNRPLRPVLLLALLAPLLLATGCSRKDSPTGSGSDDLPPHILNLMRDRTSGPTDMGCMGCHNPSTSPRADLTTYSSVFAIRSSVRAKIQPTGSMRFYLQPGEAQIITDWIDQGAPR